MGGRGGDKLNGSKLLRHKVCNLAHGLALDHNRKIKAAGHKQKAGYLGVVVYLFGNLVKAQIALGLDLDLDQRGNVFAVSFVPVDKSFISYNDAVFLVFLDQLFDIARFLAAHYGKLCRGKGCIIL